ncbi:hypothetical protein BV25DRAFT_1842464 [Artomyces pyxidatus]|uniref:Uncharacterized protein n=1 Tax=Artomyces pyxidatus TaxID=48021 RepID=A0ACB8SJX8_9AGAM|nr:hypothetical protein BV25DRAFT_1842464 [Artomyces pyxidatus]
MPAVYPSLDGDWSERHSPGVAARRGAMLDTLNIIYFPSIFDRAAHPLQNTAPLIRYRTPRRPPPTEHRARTPDSARHIPHRRIPAVQRSLSAFPTTFDASKLLPYNGSQIAADEAGDEVETQADDQDAAFIDDVGESSEPSQALTLYPRLERDTDGDQDPDSDQEVADMVQRARSRARAASQVTTARGPHLRRAILDITAAHQQPQRDDMPLTKSSDDKATPATKYDDNDAVLFAIRVPERHASNVCKTLNSRIGRTPYSQSRRDTWPDIVSVERYDTANGYVYIRAHSWRAVTRVIGRTPHLSARKQAPLLVDQIPSPSASLDLTPTFNTGLACRIASGRYAGDLAVTSKIEADCVWVYVVPRLDYRQTTLCDLVFNNALDSETRPPANLVLHPRAISDTYHNSVVDIDPDRSTFSAHGYRFESGLIQLPVHTSHFQPQPLPATVEELFIFDKARRAPVSAMRELDIQNLRKTLESGEPIEVTRGDLIGTSGFVVSILDDVVTLSDEGDTFEVPIYDVQRHFRPGDSVQVLVHGGQHGLVAFIGSSRRLYCIEDDTLEEFSAPPALVTRYTPAPSVITPREHLALTAQNRLRRLYPADKDRLLHKHVRIMVDGPWKGYEGYVRSIQAEGELANVALTAVPGKQVAIYRYNLFDADSPNNIVIPDDRSRWRYPLHTRRGHRPSFLRQQTPPRQTTPPPDILVDDSATGERTPEPAASSSHAPPPMSWADIIDLQCRTRSFQVPPQAPLPPSTSQPGPINPLQYTLSANAPEPREIAPEHSWLCRPAIVAARAEYRLSVSVQAPGNAFHKLIGNTLLPRELPGPPPADHIHVRLRGTIETVPIAHLRPIGTRDIKYSPGAILIKGPMAGQHCKITYASTTMQDLVAIITDAGKKEYLPPDWLCRVMR